MNTAVARLNWEGQVVDGKFPLQKWLGGSERCDVFRTELPGQPPQAAAIKLVSADAGNAERQVNRWQTVATLTHPNLLRVLHAGQCQINSTPLIYVVMEYAEEDLSQVMPLRALSPEEARETLMPLVAALSYLHEKSFVHSRIKPPNILAVGVTLVKCLSQRPEIREGSRQIAPGDAETISEPFRRIARECLRRDPKTRCTLADIRNWLRPASAAPAVLQPTKRPARSSLR